MRADAIVLGAGMVGVSAALHLQKRGRAVVLIDKHDAAGEETSYGNAGIIERSTIFPRSFPREFRALTRYALNLSAESHYHFSALPSFWPWLFKYYRASAPHRWERTARAALPLIENSLSEHEALMREADVLHLLRRTGWIKGYRSAATFDKGIADAERLRPFGVPFDILDANTFAFAEPHVTGILGAVHFTSPAAVIDPGGLAKAYAALFVTRGGRFTAGDARALEQTATGWRVGDVEARDVVVALGPWSDDIFRPLGYRIPLAAKRGYHMHYGTRGNAVLNHPLLDSDEGYLLAPMTRGIRLTTGVEFARRDAAKTPVQLDMVEPIARKLFPLAERRDAEPWMGARPCLPDMLPVIGPAPRHKGLWFDFGHQHHGFTQGPVSGRLIAEMISGETSFTDAAPYRADRF
jgi:D-amino-acid dehydrogenase